jgi:hypothetical protein
VEIQANINPKVELSASELQKVITSCTIHAEKEKVYDSFVNYAGFTSH